MSFVTEVPAAPNALALAHFESIFQFETDCWDVHQALTSNAQDFVLLDVRGPDQFAKAHIGGALGRPVKVMPGGITGWIDEGFSLESSSPASERPGSVPTNIHVLSRTID